MQPRRLVTLAATALLMAVVVAASHAPLPSHTGGARLRLAWSATPERMRAIGSWRPMTVGRWSTGW